MAPGRWCCDRWTRPEYGNEWWPRAVEVWPDYDGYQAKTDRLIAIYLLEPIEE